MHMPISLTSLSASMLARLQLILLLCLPLSAAHAAERELIIGSIENLTQIIISTWKSNYYGQLVINVLVWNSTIPVFRMTPF
jgi:hypothetical protein